MGKKQQLVIDDLQHKLNTLVQALQLIHHATAPNPLGLGLDDGAYHENAYDLADAALKGLNVPISGVAGEPTMADVAAARTEAKEVNLGHQLANDGQGIICPNGTHLDLDALKAARLTVLGLGYKWSGGECWDAPPAADAETIVINGDAFIPKALTDARLTLLRMGFEWNDGSSWEPKTKLHVPFTPDGAELMPWPTINAAVRTLRSLGYEHRGGELWAPPLGERRMLSDEYWALISFGAPPNGLYTLDQVRDLVIGTWNAAGTSVRVSLDQMRNMDHAAIDRLAEPRCTKEDVEASKAYQAGMGEVESPLPVTRESWLEVDEPTVVGQIRDFMEGIGASEDRQDIHNALASLGIPPAMRAEIMGRIVGRSAATESVSAERQRQVIEKGYGPSHDDRIDGGRHKLAVAGACYMLYSDSFPQASHPPSMWPWPKELWKPKDYRTDLVRGVALGLAAIESFDRRTARTEDEKLTEHIVATVEWRQAAYGAKEVVENAEGWLQSICLRTDLSLETRQLVSLATKNIDDCRAQLDERFKRAQGQTP